jgi:serine protease Do
MRRLVTLLIILLLFLGAWNVAGTYIPQLKQNLELQNRNQKQQVKVVTEESVTIDIVKKVGPSVITVLEEALPSSSGEVQFGPFSIFGIPVPDQNQETQPASIGSGFIISKDGLVVTNKHVVSDTNFKYQVVTSDEKKFTVKKIYRDPLNDIAVLQIDPKENSGVNLKPVEMGDSSSLQVGQYVVAIGTALGEFNNTITTGVISGLGRGITAGDAFAGYVEKLDNVIQTDAAINPGNSGGPLVNSLSQVIGINTAIAQGGQNIGFALPINTVKDSLKYFNEHGKFDRAYLGVSYKMVSKNIAVVNEIAEGAYIDMVVKDSPAEKAGIKAGDVITKFNGKKISGDDNLAELIAERKTGDIVSITVWRNGKTIDLKVKLTSAPSK